MSKVFFVTGSTRGLGRQIAEAVLARGDKLVAPARDPRPLAEMSKGWLNWLRNESHSA